MGTQDTSSNTDMVLTILEEISDHPVGISLAEISKTTEIAKTTMFRTLKALKARKNELLHHIRENGFAYDHEESEDGLTCIAKPAFNYTGTTAGAISVAGPTARITAKMDAVRDHLHAVCHLLSRRLGYISEPNTERICTKSL